MTDKPPENYDNSRRMTFIQGFALFVFGLFAMYWLRADSLWIAVICATGIGAGPSLWVAIVNKWGGKL